MSCYALKNPPGPLERQYDALYGPGALRVELDRRMAELYERPPTATMTVAPGGLSPR